ncbi:MAG: glycosyltransferase [Actinomycetota bacterium]|nr:glycosyltransferase [Actinomycetota bacterium]
MHGPDLTTPARPLRVLTWHVHGNYLWNLCHVPHQIYLPVKPGGAPGYGGRAGAFPWPANVHDVPAGEVAALDVDCVVFQSHQNWAQDQYEILSPVQRAGPRIYLEHDPPRRSPTDTPHPVDDPEVLVVHVTHFNQLMWDNGPVPTMVVEHGVALFDDVPYTGELERGIVVVNNMGRRGRRLGADVFSRVAREIPLDLVGMGSGECGGLGEVSPPELPRFETRYRFMFNPIRYTSLGLAVCEAMMLGIPVMGLATTEMAAVIENGVSGWVDTNVDRLVEVMRRLLADPEEARRLGAGARRSARERFSIERFVADWDLALRRATGTAPALGPSTVPAAARA